MHQRLAQSTHLFSPVFAAFLVQFQTLCLRRAHKQFSFRNFSIGNGFLTGARDFFGSLPSAIFLFKAVAGVEHGVRVIPVINTNHTVTIAARLADSTTLVGQCSISHPAFPSATLAGSRVTSEIHAMSHLRHGSRRDSSTFDTSIPQSRRSSLDEYSPNLSGSGGNLGYRKGEDVVPLDARIEGVFYLNLYGQVSKGLEVNAKFGQEVFPEPNPEFLETINSRDVLVYSCGSLWTSIVPCLALRGMATAIATSPSLRAKVVLREFCSADPADFSQHGE